MCAPTPLHPSRGIRSIRGSAYVLIRHRIPTMAADQELARARLSLAALVDLWGKQRTASIEFRAELDEKQALAIHSHANHAVGLARAILVLEEAGFGVEMIPIVRAVYETAITAAWLLVTPHSGDVLIRQGASDRRKAQDDMIRLGDATEDTPGYRQTTEVLELLEDVSGSFAFEQRCRSLADGGSLYLTFRILSSWSHAGMGLMDFYVDEDPESAIEVAVYHAPKFETRTSVVGVAACALLLALNADELARRKPAHTTQLRSVAKRLGASDRITRRDGTELPAR
jgi:hypothetical protein